MNKEIYRTHEFEDMSWHDCKIYAIAFDEVNFLLSFDIDYIFDWINPKHDETNYKFMVSPATLTFENVWNLQLDLQSNLSLDIDEVSRSNPRSPRNEDVHKDVEYDWIIQLQQGEISFCSIGFKQFIRGLPVLLDRQSIGLNDRGGVNLS